MSQSCGLTDEQFRSKMLRLAELSQDPRFTIYGFTLHDLRQLSSHLARNQAQSVDEYLEKIRRQTRITIVA